MKASSEKIGGITKRKHHVALQSCVHAYCHLIIYGGYIPNIFLIQNWKDVTGPFILIDIR